MKSFFKNKAIASGLFMMVFYQIMMIGIFMSGYSAVPKNIDKLSVAIVNEDQQYGEKFVQQLGQELPFHVLTYNNLETAQKKLEDRDIYLIMHIPQDFTQKLSAQGQQVKLDYYINQSNPAATNSTVQNVASQLTAKISAELQTSSIEGVLQNMKMPAAQSKEVAAGIVDKVSSNVVITNPQPAGMHNQMAPMFLTMASYVGAMIYSMMSIGALNQLKGKLGKWKAFLSLQGVNVILSLTAPLFGLGIYFSIHSYSAGTFTHMWLLHALELFTAIQFTSIPCLLLGQGGMLLNLPLMLVQTIASGAVLPQVMMPGFFRAVSHASLMYYTVQLDYNTLFGGGQTAGLLLGLGLITLSALLVNAVIHYFKAYTAVSRDAAPQPLFM
ncbi:YhgE/Pip domain-containing protein [Paenibacillus sp. BAC0078]